jgi:hypothetical protein
VVIVCVCPVFNVLDFSSATLLVIVPISFTLAVAKLAPKSIVRVLPVGDPPNENFAEPS